MWNESYARPHGGSGGGGCCPTPPVSPIGAFKSPVYTNTTAPFAKLSAQQVFDAFVVRGLAENSKVEGKGTSNKDFKYKEEILFLHDGFVGHICEFDNEGNFYKAQEMAIDLNEKGKYNWSVAHENIILVIDGKLPVEEWVKLKELLREL
jgi:hypothetical protein